MTELSASLYAADPFRLAEEIEAVSPHVESFHLDIMDGMFAPEFGLTAGLVRELRDRTTIPLDVHLMVGRPEKPVVSFSEMGVRSLAIHVESAGADFTTLSAIARANGVRAYAALRHTTPTSKIRPLLDHIDGCLVLTAPAGGGDFDTAAFDRLRALPSELYTVVDGKITPLHFERLERLDVDLAVVGGALFSGGRASERASKLAGMLGGRAAPEASAAVR